MNKKIIQFSKKRSNTRIDSMEKKYGVDFGVRSDKQLGSYLEEMGYQSLGDLLRTKGNDRKK